MDGCSLSEGGAVVRQSLGQVAAVCLTILEMAPSSESVSFPYNSSNTMQIAKPILLYNRHNVQNARDINQL